MFSITAGPRTTALLILALTFCAYGIGIVVGYEPTFSTALHLPIQAFGIGWIVSGVFMATGILFGDDRWHFTVAAAVASSWGLLLATHWTQPHGWTAAISWLSVCAMTILIAYWPDQPLQMSAHLYLNNQEIDARIKRLERALTTAGIEIPSVEGKDYQDGSPVSSRREAERQEPS